MIIPLVVDIDVQEDEAIDLYVQDDSGVDVACGEAVIVHGSDDYTDLRNKPSINNVTLEGNILLPQLGLRGIYYDTKANWDAQPSLIAEEGAVYIYKDFYTISENDEVKETPAIKVGDGTSYLIDMPVVNGVIADMLLDHINNTMIHVSSGDRQFWDNKSSAYLDPGDAETLVLSNTNFMLGGIIHNHG